MANDTLVSGAELPGVWKRTLLVDEAGSEDAESEVYWLQSTKLCGDIRKHLRPSTMADLAANNGAPMMDAFAGELIETDGVFRWKASLSYRDPNGQPDEGRLSWIGDDLDEHGVHSAYRERWVRIAPASSHDFALALRHPEGGRQCWVVKVGPLLFFARELAPAPGGTEFSLFDMAPDAPRLVLSTATPDQAMCPWVEFADDERRTVRLSPWTERAGRAGEIWHVAAMEGCADAFGGDLNPPSIAGHE